MIFRARPTINTLHIILFASALMIFGLQIFLANSMAGDNFELKTLGKKIDEFRGVNSQLELEASQAQSLSILRDSGDEIGLEEAVRVSYIQAKSSESIVLGNH